MSRLLVSSRDGQLLETVDLDDRLVLTIGRSPRCDLTVNSPSVSRRHAILLLYSGRWHILDTKSTTGVHLESGAIPLAVMVAGGWVKIGPVYLWIDAEGDKPVAGRAVEGDDTEQVGSREITGPTIMNDSVERSMSITLFITDDKGKPIVNHDLDDGGSCIIGSGQACDIKIDGDNVEELHCLLYQEQDRWHVADIATATGTRVSGTIINRWRCEDDRIIRIGPYIMWIKLGVQADAANARTLLDELLE